MSPRKMRTSGRKQRPAPAPEVTARPRPIAEDLGKRPATDSGLSVDPEDLGRQFLNDATEQQNFESSSGGDVTEQSIVEGAASDAALTGPNFDTDHDVWEHSVDLALQSGGPEEARAEASREGTDQNQGLDGVEQDVDLTEDSIHEASLLDEEDDELGETREPRVATDDQEPSPARG